MAMQTAKRRKQSSKGALIKGYIEMVPSSSFALLADNINKMLRQKAGIYALYKEDELYLRWFNEESQGTIGLASERPAPGEVESLQCLYGRAD